MFTKFFCFTLQNNTYIHYQQTKFHDNTRLQCKEIASTKIRSAIISYVKLYETPAATALDTNTDPLN